MSKRSQERWRHNSYLGWAAMMKIQASGIASAPTTTGVTKRIASEIAKLADELSRALKERVGP